jgi:uncharacterized protein
LPRPQKLRRVTATPGATYFKPRGIPMSLLTEIVLTVDEFEAIRLADWQGLSQAAAAAKMKISRATFGRIVEKGRRTVADAIVHGKAIRIEGGNYRTRVTVGFECRNCRRHWQLSAADAAQGECPRCRQRA